MAAREPWIRRPRDLDGAWLAIDDLRDRVDRMQIADEVAERVKHELETHRKLALTGVQKATAVFIGLGTVADLILRLKGMQ